jgi:nitroreductase
MDLHQDENQPLGCSMNHPFKNDCKDVRIPDYPVDPFILYRWSPRAMTGKEIKDSDLFSLFEAAHYAPSSYNNQPWRFLYAKRNTPAWNLFFDLMIDFNKGWTKNAAVLVVVISKKTFEHNGKPARTHSFDTGAAWMALALQGASKGYVVHGMEGFDYEKAYRTLNIPDDYQVEAMIAIGERAEKTTLSPELQQKEAPALRRPLKEVLMEGTFRR